MRQAHDIREFGSAARRLSLISLAAAAAIAGPAHAGSQWTIVATYPIPESASGLAWDGTFLYCGIYGVNGGQVYRIDPANGAYTLEFTGPHADAYGLTFDGEYLWTTDHPGGSSTPAVALRLDWDGNVIGQITLPTHYVSGIAWDNGNFWVSRYYPDPGHVYKVNAAGVILDEFNLPDNQPWDLCQENGALWVADYWGDSLYRIDPRSGALLDSHPSQGIDPAGIVWDGQHLWYCDNGEGGNDFLYKVDLDGAGTPQIDLPSGAHDFGVVSIGDDASFNLTVQNFGDAALEIEAVTFGGQSDLSCPAILPLSIAPGGSGQLPIVYAPSSFGVLNATAMISSNDPVHPDEPVALTGYGVYPDPTLGLSAAAHDYGAVRVNAHTRWFLEIANHGNQTLSVSRIAIDDGHFYLDQAVSLPITLAPLEVAAVGVWFSPAAPAAFDAALTIDSNDPAMAQAAVALGGSGDGSPQPIGQTLWTYLIDVDFDNSPKAMTSIPDVSGDGIPDVVVCSEDDRIRCFNANSDGTADVLWEHEIAAGSVYSQNGVQVIPDIDEDGHADVVVGAAWGARLVRALSGASGDEIWTYDTHEYGGGGWVYQVNCAYDYNSDGSVDVLAATGDDSTDTGPKRVFCLNGLSGVKLWERPLLGPVFGVIGVEDFTGDGHPDVVAGASNNAETQGRAVGIDGTDGTQAWTFLVSGSSVWALAQIDDITSDGVSDVVIGDFLNGNIHGLDATDGSPQYFRAGIGTLTRFERLNDIDGDGHPDILPTHFDNVTRAISGATGAVAWSTALFDSAANAARIADISGDGINDVVVGTLFGVNWVYFLDGAEGTILQSANYGTPVDAITAIPDVCGDGSWEMVVGGRNGLVTCRSGGTAVAFDPADVNEDGQVDVADLVLLILAWGPNPGHPADINGDGVVDVTDLVTLILAWS